MEKLVIDENIGWSELCEVFLDRTGSNESLATIDGKVKVFFDDLALAMSVTIQEHKLEELALKDEIEKLKDKLAECEFDLDYYKDKLEKYMSFDYAE